MSLSIRLKRISLKRKIFYQIVVEKKGERKVLDYLGFYFVIMSNKLYSDKVVCKVDKFKLYRWVASGATISPSLKKIVVHLL